MNVTLAPPAADFDAVPDLDPSDLQCMAAVAAVLHEHGKLDRFDLALAHRHFDLASDEMLVETNDPTTRTLLVRPVALGDLEPDVVIRETQWQLDVDGAQASRRCRQACFVDFRDRHRRSHHYVR